MRSSAKVSAGMRSDRGTRGADRLATQEEEKACALIDNSACRGDKHKEAQAAFGKWNSNAEEEVGFPQGLILREWWDHETP